MAMEGRQGEEYGSPGQGVCAVIRSQPASHPVSSVERARLSRSDILGTSIRIKSHTTKWM